MIGTVYNKGR